jgi:hypothetical protein
MVRDMASRWKANHMNKLVTLTLTDNECLCLRMALNATAIEWGDKASAARIAGNDVDADTCQRIRADYHRLWDMVNEAQEAPGRVQDWVYRRPARETPDPLIAECENADAGAKLAAALKAAPDTRLALFDADAVNAAVEYLDLAHGDSNPDVNAIVWRLTRDAVRAPQ